MKHSASLPTFTDIIIQQVPDRLNQLLNQNRVTVDQLLQQNHYTWDNLMQPLEELGEQLHHFWSPISHMNAVINNDEIRHAYHECLPKLAEFHTELKHNKKLYFAIQQIAESPDFTNLDRAQQKIIENSLRDFKLAGATLNEDKKKEFAELVKDLSQLSSKFEENVLDATNAWTKHITDEKDLLGIPSHTILQAKERAESENLSGWLFSLAMPSYIGVMTHADSRAFREEMYHAYITRASDIGPSAKKWDNSEVMFDILSKRLALAKLLDFNNYAELSLATKMVKTTDAVINFLSELATHSFEKAQKEFEHLSQFAKKYLNIAELKPWDINFASEKLRQHEYAISQEKLRPYFPEHNVVNGLFAIAKRLFQIEIEEVSDVDVWHSDARCYAVYDKTGKIRSYFYLDLYARPNKRGGAWMDDCRGRRKKENGEIQIPIAFIIGNFNRPTKNQPALFSHDEVVTLFHEFGHALQHMLTTVDYSEVSGINGIPWDAVEVASQFLENWTWHLDALSLFAKHFETDEVLPRALYDKLYNTKNFQSAMIMVRQLEFALFDFLLHINFDPKQKNQIQEILNQVRSRVSVVPASSDNRFQHGFSHIFAGGYAAGYYSYKWAEVMASDAFSLFLERGIFDVDAANKFLTYILEPGGSEDPEILYKKFRGRDPNINALLQQSGITN